MVVIDAAFVAAAQVPCVQCGERIEVIALYGERGMDLEWGNPIAQFTLPCVWALDEASLAQLEPWPSYRWVGGTTDEGYFANHCRECGAVQEEYLLHSEPGDVFFGLSRAAPGAVRFMPLPGTVRVSGDVSFAV